MHQRWHPDRKRHTYAFVAVGAGVNLAARTDRVGPDSSTGPV